MTSRFGFGRNHNKSYYVFGFSAALVIGLVAVVGLVLIAASLFLAPKWLDNRNLGDGSSAKDRAEIIAVVDEFVVRFNTFDGAPTPEHFDAIADLMTNRLYEEYVSGLGDDDLWGELSHSAVARGTGVVNVDGDTATVLTVFDLTVARGGEQVLQLGAWEITLLRQGDAWFIDRVGSARHLPELDPGELEDDPSDNGAEEGEDD